MSKILAMFHKESYKWYRQEYKSKEIRAFKLLILFLLLTIPVTVFLSQYGKLYDILIAILFMAMAGTGGFGYAIRFADEYEKNLLKNK